jgi:hypothetical protein
VPTTTVGYFGGRIHGKSIRVRLIESDDPNSNARTFFNRDSNVGLRFGPAPEDPLHKEKRDVKSTQFKLTKDEFGLLATLPGAVWDHYLGKAVADGGAYELGAAFVVTSVGAVTLRADMRVANVEGCDEEYTELVVVGGAQGERRVLERGGACTTSCRVSRSFPSTWFEMRCAQAESGTWRSNSSQIAAS